MGSFNSNSAKVPTETSPLPKAWLADLHKDFEGKIRATEQHEQLQAAARSKRRPKERKSAHPVDSRYDDQKPLTVSSATSADTVATPQLAASAHKQTSKHKTKPIKHNDLSNKAKSVPAMHKDTSVPGVSAPAVAKKHPVHHKASLKQQPSTTSQASVPGNVQIEEATLDEFIRRKDDEERTIPSEDEQWARSHDSQGRMRKLSRNILQEKPATVVSSAPTNSIPTTSAPLPEVARAQDTFTISDGFPAMARPEQRLTERHKTYIPEIAPTLTNGRRRVTRPSTPDSHDIRASTPRYDVEELKAMRKSYGAEHLRSWDIEQDMQHIFTTSSAATLRAFAQYQLTLDEPIDPEEVPARDLDPAEAHANHKMVSYCPEDRYGLTSTHAESTEIAVADPWTSAEVIEKDAVPMVLLGLAARARARKQVLVTEVPVFNHSTRKLQAAIEPQKTVSSRRNKAKTTKPTANNDKLTYKSGEKPAEFLDLPFEVQTTILEYALLQDEHIHVDALFRTLNKKPGEFQRRGYGALFVCHHFHKIGRAAYYAINTFTMSLGLWISLPRLMIAWPNVPRYANNIQPALMHTKHIIVAQLGPGEHGSTYGLWRHLVQFLRPFRHLEIVEIDLREPEYGSEPSGEEIDKVAPVPSDLRQRLQKTGGIRIGWAKRETGMTGIKEGALVCRTTRSQTQHWTQLSLSQVMNALP